MATLKRTETGYATADGRWTVEPVTMGEGVNGNRGWSKGKREWRITDTTSQATLGMYGRPSLVVPALWRARDIIDYHQEA